MDKVRVGFVGVGSMGQMAHLRNYVDLPDCQVVAIAELREQTARMVAQRYGVAKVYRDHKEMLAAEKLDGVVASQHFSHHAALIPEIYPHVRNVFTEKPLAVSPQAGRALADAAAEAGCVHMVGYNKRSDPATEFAKGVIEEWKRAGAMGRLTYVRILMPAGDWIAGGFTGLLNAGEKPPALPGEPPAGDMDAPARKAYMSFVNYYIHQVNLMRHLLGEPYEVTYAEPSGVLLAGRSASGAPCTIEMTPYRTTLGWEESALIAFEKGYLKLRLPPPLAVNLAGTVEVYEDPGDGAVPKRWSPSLPPLHAMRKQAINFLKVCRGEIKPPCDASEAVQDLDIAREYIRRRYGQ